MCLTVQNEFHTCRDFFSLSVICVKKASHLCHSAGPPTAITNPISCFRESEPPACCFWPLTKSQKYENYPSSRGLQLFKSHQRSFWQTSTWLRSQTWLAILPTAATTKPLAPFSPQRNKGSQSCLYGCIIQWPHGLAIVAVQKVQINSVSFLSACYQLSHTPAGLRITPASLSVSHLSGVSGPRNSLTWCCWVLLAVTTQTVHLLQVFSKLKRGATCTS